MSRLVFSFKSMQSEYNFYYFSWRKEFMELIKKCWEEDHVTMVLESHNVALGKA